MLIHLLVTVPLFLNFSSSFRINKCTTNVYRKNFLAHSVRPEIITKVESIASDHFDKPATINDRLVDVMKTLFRIWVRIV